MTIRDRATRNSIKISELHPSFAVKVRAILRDLEGKGWSPVIVCGWRSEEEQLRLYKQKRTKIKYGFHNITGKNGKPESFAVDIIDANLGYKAPNAFWLMLASSALAHGCETGVLWTGANILLRKRIADAIKERKFYEYKGPLGWDPSHVQMFPSSKLADLKKGWRPK